MTHPDLVPFLDIAAATAELRAELDAAIARVVGSGWYIGGPEVDAFERQFAEYCGTAHCAGVANGLDALALLLRATDIGPGAEVIVPSNTYIATWLAVTQVGATPVPVEPVAGTSNLDPDRVEAAITPRTRALLPVHLYGQTADMAPLLEIARQRGMRVFEDAAQAHGARYRGRKAGALADAAAWSFYPGKNLGALGDAGGITTDDTKIADRVRVLRNYGSRVKYYNEVVGYNSRLDPMQAAVLGAKLPHLDAWNARRQAVAARYLTALRDVPGVTLPEVGDGCVPVWHLFVIKVAHRDRVQQALAERGVQTLIHYPVPPHLSGAYQSSGWRAGAFPIAERLADTVISLPMGPHITPSQQDQVIAAVRAAQSDMLGS